MAQHSGQTKGIRKEDQFLASRLEPISRAKFSCSSTLNIGRNIDTFTEIYKKLQKLGKGKVETLCAQSLFNLRFHFNFSFKTFAQAQTLDRCVE